MSLVLDESFATNKIKMIVIRNKSRLVAQGYTQVDGLNFGETYALVARLEAIRILLAYACAHNIKLYQIDVKSAFLNGYVNGQVYVEQPPSFEDDKKPYHIYKLRKALYVLKKAPRAWYERLRYFLLSKGFKMGKVDFGFYPKLIPHYFSYLIGPISIGILPMRRLWIWRLLINLDMSLRRTIWMEHGVDSLTTKLLTKIHWLVDHPLILEPRLDLALLKPYSLMILLRHLWKDLLPCPSIVGIRRHKPCR